jgi:hypothetical protein
MKRIQEAVTERGVEDGYRKTAVGNKKTDSVANRALEVDRAEMHLLNNRTTMQRYFNNNNNNNNNNAAVVL